MSDLVYEVYKKYEDWDSSNLAVGKIDFVIGQNTSQQENLDQIAKEQAEFYANHAKKTKSIGLLNKLLTESEVREKDLLNFASSSGFYQLFIYSTPLSKFVKSLDIDGFDTQPNRSYPKFLAQLGFARLGKRSSYFVINKSNLKRKTLRNAKDFKKFLMHHLSKIREKEWNELLTEVELKDKEKFDKIKDIDFRSKGFLKINFLLTETRMNLTNIGFVDGDRIGLAEVENNKQFNKQILGSVDVLGQLNEEEIKVKIKKIINRQDVSILLHTVELGSKTLIQSEQDAVLKNLRIQSILELSTVNPIDLTKELVRLGIIAAEAEEISNIIITRAEEYSNALDELNIRLN